MKKLRLLPAVLLIAIIASCSKNAGTVSPVTPPPHVTPAAGSDVYMAGTVNNVATIWKNGVPAALTAPSRRTAATAIFVRGTDVFVAGYGTDEKNGNGVAIVWKNGVPSTLSAPNPDAKATSIYVSPSGGLYVAGYSTILYQNNQAYPNNGIMSYRAATLWVGGTPTILSDGNKAYFDNNGILQHGQNTNRESAATGVYANGSDIYVSGWEDYGAYGQVNATLWKNGNKLVLYNSIGGDYTNNKPVPGFLGKFFTGDTTYVIAPTFSLSSLNQATSVFVSSSGDVYTAGFVTQGAQNGGIQVNAPHRATIWKNGIEKAQGDSTHFADPNSVFVSGNDVYAVGFAFPTGKIAPILWKNGMASVLNDSGSGAIAKSVFVSGTDVYVAGNEYISTALSTTQGILWKNGVETVFTDVTNTTIISSVFIVPK